MSILPFAICGSAIGRSDDLKNKSDRATSDQHCVSPPAYSLAFCSRLPILVSVNSDLYELYVAFHLNNHHAGEKLRGIWLMRFDI
ncbi:MAG: hypothetical protein AUI45_00665 [Acidobacteria bacterium 13_1_40CM_2_56_11]|nr:MAG: hypothetical protein AUI45_00665 [Acidobacteria bacterium 13_1_40CM_2_56_11]